jgi:hypothetical protein
MKENLKAQNKSSANLVDESSEAKLLQKLVQTKVCDLGANLKLNAVNAKKLKKTPIKLIAMHVAEFSIKHGIWLRGALKNITQDFVHVVRNVLQTNLGFASLVKLPTQGSTELSKALRKKTKQPGRLGCGLIARKLNYGCKWIRNLNLRLQLDPLLIGT